MRSKPHSKAPTMAGRQRKSVDTSKYSGRLAVHLRTLCDAKGLTVEAFAEKCEVPMSIMYAYLAGDRGIPADVFPLMAKALGVDAAEFLPSFKARK
jgi:transcriptional regulator with XRE-family HTH domain